MSFIRACAVGDVADATALRVEIDGLDVAIVHSGDEFYAIEDECSHAQIALSEGEVDGCEIECWLHGSRFDLRTGKPTNLPATEPVPIFPVRIEGGDLFVDIESPIKD